MDFPRYINGLETIHNQKLLWVYLEKPTREKLEMISKKFPIHELNMEDCLSKNQLPKIDRYDDHVFVILQFPTTSKEQTSPSFSQLSFFVGKDYLISITQGDLHPLSSLFRKCKEGNDSIRNNLMGGSPGYLLHSILDTLVDNLLHMLVRIIGKLDDIEDEVFDDKVANARDLSILRREITTLRRIVLPLKRIMMEITSRDVKRFSEGVEEEDLIDYFDDINDHISKVLEALDESKETIEIYKDTDNMLNSEKTNKILSFLTILFTLSIPITVAGTFYGMNIVIPGSVNPGDKFVDYIPLAIISSLSAVGAGIMIYYFKKLGWINS
ncbi:magnesium transporter CorA family protein [Candidatus Nitrosocosmicus hydrocola]|uniref:magnesium transporter CorA family protein n=1 Tax=Candidatus Nitrosocosmicus hydrocola TaxID=1826872 RepID=UPI001E555D02|nr:magnesium transporter CorA family protein [Candidatus Nitrosocosmicus hydrocola]